MNPSLGDEIAEDIRERERIGYERYRIHLVDRDWTPAQFAQEAYEEALDQLFYLKTLIKLLQNNQH